MLFSTYTFIFMFLPITLSVYLLLRKQSMRVAMTWLALASLFFYGWWNPRYLILMLGSVIGNFVLGRLIAASSKNKRHLHSPGGKSL